jgi:succinate dehydrogenase / fumarate reductase, cytochrome b subunit
VATTVGRPVENSSAKISAGVPPLRAGQGNSFLLRRLHSLSGIVPVGAFLLEHFISNAFATNGPDAYIKQVKFLTGLPFAIWLEIFGIYIPILFHALYGTYIWWRGDNNSSDYPWMGNWMYTLQRWTGIVAFAYMAWHVYTMRLSGVHLFDWSDAAFWKVQHELTQRYAQIFYFVGIVSASWHFGYGVFLFCAKWGIVVGNRARKRMQVVGLAISAVLIAIGMLTMNAFIHPSADWPKQERKPEWNVTRHEAIQKGIVKPADQE